MLSDTVSTVFFYHFVYLVSEKQYLPLVMLCLLSKFRIKNRLITCKITVKKVGNYL